MKSFDEIYALATTSPHSKLAETFTDPRLSWGVGVTRGVAVAMQEAQAEIDALKAQRDALLAAQQWQPIESAPKNTHLLLLAGNTPLIGVGLYDSYLGYWNWKYGEEPTLWMPLPPPPEAKARGGSAFDEAIEGDCDE